MKNHLKLTALLISLVMTITSICVPLITAMADVDATVVPSYLCSFTSESDISKAVLTNTTQNNLPFNTKAEFDEEIGTMKLTALDIEKESPMTFAVIPDVSVPITENPVLAIRIKRSGGAEYEKTYTEGSGLIKRKKTKYSLQQCPFNNDYLNTELWQTIVIDTTGYYNNTETPNMYFFENWYSMLFSPAKVGTVGESDAIYVQWVGIFKTEDDAMTYSVENTLNKNGEPDYDAIDYERTMAKPIENGLLFDFETKDDIKQLQSDVKSDISFDEENSALKLTVNEISNGRTSAYWNIYNDEDCKFPTFSIKDYGVMLMRVKYSESAVGIAMSLPACVGTSEKFTFNGMWNDLIYSSRWNTSTEWQNVYYTFSADISEDIYNIYIDPLRGGKVGDFALVDYVAVFTDMQAAKYYAGEGGAAVGSIIDFKSNSDISKIATSDGNTKISYDETENAMKIEAIDWNADYPCKIRLMPTTDLRTDYYPVLAFRVKLPRKEMQFGGFAWRTSEYAQHYKDTIASGGSLTYFAGFSEKPSYIGNTDWQLVIIDGTDYLGSNFDGVWLDTVIQLLPKTNTGLTADDAIYMDWIGFFDSPSAVYKYAGVEDTSKADDPTPIFWKFTNERSIINNVNLLGDIEATFDTTERAMAITISDYDGDGTTVPGKLEFGTKSYIEAGCSVEDYPIIAFHARLSNPDIIGGELSARTSGTVAASKEGKLPAASLLVDQVKYQRTYSWQTVIIDCQNDEMLKYLLTGDWKSFNVQFMSASAVVEDTPIYLDWIGAFKTKDDVVKYAGKDNIILLDDETEDIINTDVESPDVENLVNDNIGDFTEENNNYGDQELVEDTETNEEPNEKLIARPSTKKVRRLVEYSYFPTWAIILIVVGGVLVISGGVFLFFFFKKRKAKAEITLK